MCTSMGPDEVRSLKAAALGTMPQADVESPARCVQVPTVYESARVVDEAFVRTAHALGLSVHVWTIDRADEMHALLDLGIDGLMSDVITVLRDVLRDRGQWTGA